MKLDLNAGARSINATSLTNTKRQLMTDIQGMANDTQRTAFLNNGFEDEITGNENQYAAIKQNQNLAKMLQVLAEQSAGRKVPITEAPAIRAGYRMKQPELFGMETKFAVPYDKLLTDTRNLKAITNGFQEIRQENGYMPTDAANILVNVKRRESLIGEAFDVKKKESLYYGAPKSAAANLFELKLRQQRENSIYNRIA